jgi:hypothetical protein
VDCGPFSEEAEFAWPPPPLRDDDETGRFEVCASTGVAKQDRFAVAPSCVAVGGCEVVT